jgi:hypothetical protein
MNSSKKSVIEMAPPIKSSSSFELEKVKRWALIVIGLAVAFSIVLFVSQR